MYSVPKPAHTHTHTLQFLCHGMPISAQEFLKIQQEYVLIHVPMMTVVKETRSVVPMAVGNPALTLTASPTMTSLVSAQTLTSLQEHVCSPMLVVSQTASVMRVNCAVRVDVVEG